MSFCHHCGQSLSPRATSCPSCGEPTAAKQFIAVPVAKKSKAIAALLCFFLGHVGGHQFYLRNWGRAWLYAAMTVGGLALTVNQNPAGALPVFIIGVLAIIDFFVILFKKPEYFIERARA